MRNYIIAIARKIYSIPNEDPVPLSEKMQQALASLALEGIALPADSLEDIRLLDSGKMSEEEFLQKTLAIAKS